MTASANVLAALPSMDRERVAAIIEARQLEKSYPQPDGSRIQVIASTDLAVYPGQIIALLGASGCGKSTLLRMLTGLSPASSGAVYWHGHPVGDESPNVSIVFQSFALFPWLTVLENVEAPLEARGMPTIERRKRSLRIIDAVGLDASHFAGHSLGPRGLAAAFTAKPLRVEKSRAVLCRGRGSDAADPRGPCPAAQQP